MLPLSFAEFCEISDGGEYCGSRPAAASSAAQTVFSLENVVYFELLRRGYQVNVGKVGNVHEYKESVPHPILDTERIRFLQTAIF